MQFYAKNKKIILFVGIFAAVAAVYEFFFSGGSAAPAPTAQNPMMMNGALVSQLSASPADAIVGQQLLSTLAQLNSISLDTSVFSNPVFTDLQDLSRPISPEPLGTAVGRRNPFLGFGVTGSSTPSSNTAGLSPAALQGNAAGAR